MKVESFQAYKYKEVWKVTKYDKEGCVVDVRSTGLFIVSEEEDLLPKGFVLSSLSTNLLKLDVIDIKVVKVSEIR